MLYTLPVFWLRPEITAIQMTRLEKGCAGLPRRAGRSTCGWPVIPRRCEMLTRSPALPDGTGSGIEELFLHGSTTSTRSASRPGSDQAGRDINARRPPSGTPSPMPETTGVSRTQHQPRLAPVDDLRIRLLADREDIQDRTHRPGVRKADPHLTKTEVPAAGQPAPIAWQGADGQPANGAAVQGLLAELSSLRCEQFIDDRDKAGLGAPVYSIILKGPHDYTLTLFAPGEKDAPRHPAVSSSRRSLPLSEDQAKRIMKPGGLPGG
jgi:hypothetical protein